MSLNPEGEGSRNQSFRNEGIKTVAWFKVSKKLKELLASQNNSQQQMMMNMYGQQGSISREEVS